jgi:hypothetical protein
MAVNRQVLWAAVLAVVAIAAVGFAVWKVTRGPEVPELVRNRTTEMVDVETLQVFALKPAEWLKLGSQGTRYKNPKTGKYTMATARICKACGAKIPFPDIPPAPEQDDRGGSGLAEWMRQRGEILAKYKCPKCGVSNPVGDMPVEPNEAPPWEAAAPAKGH